MVAPLVSVVTGTYNRYPHLKAMVESVRKEVYLRMPYEIVVVDGGSTDDTLDWAAAQSDIVLIRQSELVGAIKAFGAGFEAASGKYVIAANDDILFLPYSIISAIAYLEDTPTCGGVAFEDNRLNALGYRSEKYNIDLVTGRFPDGEEKSVPYAQVGCFRRDVGEKAGWWGHRDPIMSQARTYGADNFLSARIWEMGHSIDRVEFCRAEDHIVRDALRATNEGEVGQRDSQIYYARFPVVPLTRDLRACAYESRVRILYCPIYESGFPGKENKEYWIGEALSRYGYVVEWDYQNSAGSLVNMVRSWKPDLLFLHCHDTNRILAEDVRLSRQFNPSMVVINWNGDAHEEGLIGPAIIDLLRHVDMQMVVNAKYMEEYAKLGIPAVYWQIPYKDPAKPVGQSRQFDILFQGNCYNAERKSLVGLLRSLPKELRVGIYGGCPTSDGTTHYDFAAQRALYSSALITIGDVYPGTYAFISNRFVQALSSGAFLLQQHSDGFDDFNGTQAGVHYIEWTDLDDLRDKIIHWINPRRDAERQKIAQNGQSFVREHFSADAAVDKIFEEIIPGILERNNAAR